MPRSTPFRVWFHRGGEPRAPFAVRLECQGEAWLLRMGLRRLLVGSGQTPFGLTPEQVRRIRVCAVDDETRPWSLEALTDALLYSSEDDAWVELVPGAEGDPAMLLPPDADSVRRVDEALRIAEDEATATAAPGDRALRRAAMRDALRAGAMDVDPTDLTDAPDALLGIRPVVLEASSSAEGPAWRSLGAPEAFRIVEDTEEEARYFGAFRAVEPGLLEPPTPAGLASVEAPASSDEAAPAEPQRSVASEPASAQAPGPSILRALRRQALRHAVEKAVLEARILELEARASAGTPPPVGAELAPE